MILDHPAPAGRAVRRAAPLLGLYCLIAAPVQADPLNVSRIATGYTASLNVSNYNAYPELACGNCSYNASSTAAISGSGSIALAPHAWPAPSVSNLPAPPAVLKNVATPEGEVDNDGATHHYDAPDYRRAQVQFSIYGHKVASNTFDGGNAAALLTYHITAENNGSSARDYFIDFRVPQKMRSIAAAYTLVPGSNGGTYVYHVQDTAFTRSQVEILVDGLPVWSQTSTYNYPADFNGYAWDYLGLDWGSTSTSRVVLYLGKRPPGTKFKIDYAIETSATADIDRCGTSHNSYPSSEVFHHCFILQEQRSLPSVTVSNGGFSYSKLDFKVFTKELP